MKSADPPATDFASKSIQQQQYLLEQQLEEQEQAQPHELVQAMA